ncbi:MAG: hypothetical protein IGR93_06925 [Hydrococcus sp. C42_A2020_068]|nr:hypothetical protein [Hydrococcus sp. C42_A2020_068]
MVAKVTSKSTKAELIEAFEELKKEKTTLESQLKKIERERKTESQESSIAYKDKEEKQKVMSSITQNNINQIIQNLEKLQVGFGSAVSHLSEQLIAEASFLEELQTEVAEELQKLEELHEIESVEEDTLDTLVASYEESAKAFEEEISQQRETLEQQIIALKKAWQKEQETYARQLKERNEFYQKARQRDEEEYWYNLELERDLSEEEYQQQKKNLYKELDEARQAQEKQWKQREESIFEKEKQYAEAKQKVEAFEQELKKKIEQAQGEGKGIGNYQAKVRADLRAKEIEGEKRNYELRIGALEQTIQNQQARIQNLSQQLDAALKQVQDLAVKAIEGASNRNSFEAIKEIALEQAKNQPKNK